MKGPPRIHTDMEEGESEFTPLSPARHRRTSATTLNLPPAPATPPVDKNFSAAWQKHHAHEEVGRKKKTKQSFFRFSTWPRPQPFRRQLRKLLGLSYQTGAMLHPKEWDDPKKPEYDPPQHTCAI